MPQIVEEFWRQGDVVVSLFKYIFGQLQPTLTPSLSYEHIHTEKEHYANIYLDCPQIYKTKF